MAHTLNRLTARTVATLKDPGRYADGGNLYLSISKNGGRRWVFMYRFRGKQREMGLGSANPAGTTLARAREFAIEARTILAAGSDPLKSRKVDRRIPTFGDCADDYIEAHCRGWRNDKHIAQWRMTLSVYCAPIGATPIDEVDTEAVLKVLQPIWDRLPETAKRLRGRIESLDRTILVGPKHPAQLALSGSSIDRPSRAPIGELCCSFSRLADALRAARS